MNSTFQRDSHPDAESLNAFAEQALPESEHSLVLAHLAVCSRCRQVVFLAQQAASEFEMQEAVAARPELDRAAYGFAAAMAPAPMAAAGATANRVAEKPRSWWSSGWRLALVPAAALAGIIGFVVFAHMQRVKPGFESGVKLALNVPQAAPQPQPKAAEPAPADKAALAKAQPAASPIPVKAPGEKVLTASANEPVETISAPAAPPAQAPAAVAPMEMSRSESYQATSHVQPQTYGAVMEPKNAPLLAQADATPRPQLATSGNPFNDTRTTAAAATSHGAAGNVQASRGTSASAPAPQFALKSAPAGSLMSSRQVSEPRAAALSVSEGKVTLLPSGLRAVSIVTASHRRLAIDSSGKLFLSDDSGNHWEPVATQWTGRAVAVRIQGGSNIEGNATPKAKAAVEEYVPSDSKLDAVSAPAAPPPVFEIVSDNESIWISTDGKNWKAK
jgi:hypothetical protein